MNNINPILVYCSWNCIYCITRKRKDLKYDLNGKIRFESNILIKDKCIFVIHSNKTCKLLQEYAIDQLVQANVFRNYFVGYQTQTRKEEIESINECKEYLFDNDFTEFNELLEYSIPDLVSTSGGINDHGKLFSADNNCDNGFSNIIGNRLCYDVFCDLTRYPLNLQNEINFPKLIKFIHLCLILLFIHIVVHFINVAVV